MDYNKSLDTAIPFVIQNVFPLFLTKTCVVETSIRGKVRAEFLTKSPTVNCVFFGKTGSLFPSDSGQDYEETYILCCIGQEFGTEQIYCFGTNKTVCFGDSFWNGPLRKKFR